MSLFKRKSKNSDDALTKNVLNIAILDLCSYSADGLKNVRKLNSAVVILPKEPDEEIMEAYGGIACKNVATEIFAENDAQVHMINGVSEVDCAQCNDHDIYMINGLAAFRNAKESTANIIINGLAVYEKNANLNFLNRHGKTIAVDFEIERVKILADKASVDKAFIENIEDGTVVLCSDMLTLEVDITPEILKSRKLFFCRRQHIEMLQALTQRYSDNVKRQ